MYSEFSSALLIDITYAEHIYNAGLYNNFDIFKVDKIKQCPYRNQSQSFVIMNYLLDNYIINYDNSDNEVNISVFDNIIAMCSDNILQNFKVKKSKFTENEYVGYIDVAVGCGIFYLWFGVVADKNELAYLKNTERYMTCIGSFDENLNDNIVERIIEIIEKLIQEHKEEFYYDEMSQHIREALMSY